MVQFGNKSNKRTILVGYLAIVFIAGLQIFKFLNQTKPLNIVLISVDTLNRSALNLYNPDAPVLPALEALSVRSVVFDNAYSTAPWTLPAHGSIFTGLYPDRHGAVTRNNKLSDHVPTLAEQLQDAGYITAGFTGGGYVSRSYGFNRGFYYYDDWRNPNLLQNYKPVSRASKPPIADEQGLFARGIEFINSWQDRKRGFFLFLHSYVVHDYFKKHSWTEKYIEKNLDREILYSKNCLLGRAACSDEEWAWLENLYKAELYQMDTGLRRLFEALDNNELTDSTLILFLSDHGEGFSPDLGRIHHGGRLHEDQIRIPLIIAGPGIEPTKLKLPVSLVDLMPTILDLADVPVADDMDGKSLVPALYGKDDRELRSLFAMEYFHLWEDGKRKNFQKFSNKPLLEAVILGEGWFIKSEAEEELYMMKYDPFQKNNIVAKSSLATEFRNVLKNRKKFNSASAPVNMSPELIKQLKSLGYVQ